MYIKLYKTIHILFFSHAFFVFLSAQANELTGILIYYNLASEYYYIAKLVMKRLIVTAYIKLKSTIHNIFFLPNYHYLKYCIVYIIISIGRIGRRKRSGQRSRKRSV